MLKSISLSKKLTIGFLLAGLIPALIVTGVVVYKVTIALNEDAESKLIAIREAKGFQIEELYKTMGGQVSALSNNKVVIEATERFIDAFDKYEQQSGSSYDEASSRLKDFYSNTFGKEFEKLNINKSFNRSGELVSSLTKTEVLLQDSFISSSSYGLGEKDKLTKLNNESDYAKVHELYHETFRTYLSKFGFYDIFLVGAKSGDVIYSVYKEIDFATSLKKGSFSNSGLAEAYSKGMSLSRGEFYFTDLGKYYPSYNAPAQFISSPIYKGNKLLGTLVFQVPVEKLNVILTSRRNWKEQGQGDSGETYIIGKDLQMKSISRFLVEDQKGFFEAMKGIGVSNDKLDYIKSKSTSALAVSIDTKGAREVVQDRKGFMIFPDYRDVNVLSAYRPLEIKGLNWYILSEMDEDEALKSLFIIEQIVGVMILVMTLIIFVVAYSFSKGISNAFANLAFKLKKSADIVLSSSEEMSQSSSSLSAATEQQASSLQETSSSISEISAMVEKNSNNASSTSQLSSESQMKAKEGKEFVGRVKEKIEKINSNNESLVRNVDQNNTEIEGITKIINDISDKTAVINDIVFQTKLLSFNASVEAARAGEHGKGFSVVAEEVGALAKMSGSAAAEITELLERSISQVHETVKKSKDSMDHIIREGQETVREGLKEITDCDDVLSEILKSFDAVNKSVEQIAASSSEQSSGVNEITDAIQQLDTATQMNSGIASSSSTKARELEAESQSLALVVKEIQEIIFGESTKAAIREVSSIKDNQVALKKPKIKEVASNKGKDLFNPDNFEDVA